MTGEELQTIKSAEAGLWANLDEDFKKYLDSIIKYNQEIEEAKIKISESMTDLSVDNLKSEWADLLDDLDSDNDDFSKSFEKHRSEEHTSELQSRQYLVCRLLL